MGEVAEGLMLDPAGLAIGAAQQVGLVDAVVVAASRGGYVDSSAAARNGEILPRYGMDVTSI